MWKATFVRASQPVGAVEAPVGVAYLSGQLRQRQIGVGYASIRDLPSASETPTLSLTEVDAAFEAVGQQAGKASQTERRRLLHALMLRATEPEQRFLAHEGEAVREVVGRDAAGDEIEIAVFEGERAGVGFALRAELAESQSARLNELTRTIPDMLP